MNVAGAWSRLRVPASRGVVACVLLVAAAGAWSAAVSLVSCDPVELIQARWPIVPLSVLAAMAANSTAVGGGIVFVPLFTFGYQISGVAALKLALATQAFGMTAGAMGWRQRLHRRALGLACAGASVGMFLGTVVWTPGEGAVRRAFGWGSLLVALALAIELLYQRRARRDPRHGVREDLRFVAVCIGGGLITAWVSIGMGEIVALYLIMRHGIAVGQAVATGVATLAFCSILGSAAHAVLGGIEWQYLVFTAPGVLVGGPLGARLGRALDDAAERPLKVLLTVVIFLDGSAMLFKSY